MSLAGLQASLLGTRMTLYLGPMLPVPAPFFVIEALQSATVDVSDDRRSGFELTFSVGRGFPISLDNNLSSFPLLKPGIRVILQVWFGAIPTVLMDGYITQTELKPSETPGGSTFVVTGEDMTVMMSLYELSLPHPQMPPPVRVATILARYGAFIGGPIIVIPPVPMTVELATERIAAQSGTDLDYVRRLAAYYHFKFYIEPTPIPTVNKAYWGPQEPAALYSHPLRVNQGPETNVTGIQFSHNAMTPYTVAGMITDQRLGIPLPLITSPVALAPPQAAFPARLGNQPFVRIIQADHVAGVDYPEAFGRAQAQADADAAKTVMVTGTLDTSVYNSILMPRRRVQIAGVGLTNDGDYYVRQVRHTLKKGQFTQSFTLSRDGNFPLTPVLLPPMGI